MSQFEFDDMDDLNEEYYFDTIEEFQSERYFVLVIYDIVDNKKRLKLSKYLLGYGIRVQKSAFEMMITTDSKSDTASSSDSSTSKKSSTKSTTEEDFGADTSNSNN